MTDFPVPRASSGKPRRLAWANPWWLPAALAAGIVARCVILSGKRLLWADELFTWYPATASFGSMLHSTTDTINSAPPLYFILVWFWTALFGPSALALRLFSALAVVAALVALFVVLRRAYGALAAALGLAVAFSDPDLLYQSAEARLHTLVIAETAIGIYLYQRIMRQRRPSLGLLAANAAVHASLVLTHYLGPLYSGAILVGVLLTGWVRRRNPLRAGLSIAAGWLAFLPWIPVFLRHREMGRPSFWIPVPDVRALLDYFGHYLTPEFWLLAKILGLAALVVTLADGRKRRRPLTRLVRLHPREAPLLLLVPGFILVPLLIYFVSTRPGGISIFLNHYLLCGALAWAIVCAHLSNRAFGLGGPGVRGPARRAWYCAQGLVVVAFLGWVGTGIVGAALQAETEQPPADVPARDPRGEPVVIEGIHEFMEWHFYSADPQRYLYLVDPEAGIKEGGGGPLNHQIMAALKRQFPHQFPEVMPSADFLAHATSFWVMRAGTPWWSMRIESNPAFLTQPDPTNETLFHVVRQQK